MLAKQRCDHRYRGTRTLDQGMTVARVGNRGRQHVAQAHRAVVTPKQHPSVEHAWNACGEKTSSRNHIESEAAKLCDRRRSGCRALPADHLRSIPPHIVQNDRHVAAWSIEMRLDDLQREGSRHSGIEG